MSVASLTSACPSEGGTSTGSATDPGTSTADTSEDATAGETSSSTGAGEPTSTTATTANPTTDTTADPTTDTTADPTTDTTTDTTGGIDTTGEPDTTTVASDSDSGDEPPPPPTPCEDVVCDVGEICVIPGPWCNQGPRPEFVFPPPFCAKVPARCRDAQFLDVCLADEYCVDTDAWFEDNTLQCPPEDLDCF